MAGDGAHANALKLGFLLGAPCVRDCPYFFDLDDKQRRDVDNAAALLDGAEIVDRVVPDLVLRGMLEAVQQAEAAEDE